LREEPKLRVFDNKVLNKIFGPKRDVVTGDRRRLHNEELHDPQPSLNVIQVIKSVGTCSMYGGVGRYIQVFGGET
jgi:hypothetical protein